MFEQRRWRALMAVVAVAGVVAPGLACSGSPAKGAERVAQAPQEKPAAPEVAYDHALTDTARVVAGISPEDANRFARVLKRPAWNTHRAEFDSNWSRVSDQRFRLMRDWRDQEFKALASSCDTLFYPFGGPDFLNAYLLYPACNRYLLFGIEQVGTVPAIEKLPDERIDAALAQVRESLSDIFLRDYFITKTMMTELRTPEVDGTLPLILAFLARLDARVISVELDGPWNPAPPATPPTPAAAAGGRAAQGGRGRGTQAAPSRVPGVTITFVAAGSTHVQTVSYIKVNMQDDQFTKRTGLLAYLKGLAPYTTFVKSASYLMHDDRFSCVRAIVLDDSTSILQDDTGVPYKFFDHVKWDLTLYGKTGAGAGLQVRVPEGPRRGLQAALGRATAAVHVRVSLAHGHIQRDAGGQEAGHALTIGTRPPHVSGSCAASVRRYSRTSASGNAARSASAADCSAPASGVWAPDSAMSPCSWGMPR